MIKITQAEQVLEDINGQSIAYAKEKAKSASMEFFVLMGSRRAIYDFEDGSRLTWNSGPNMWEVNCESVS